MEKNVLKKEEKIVMDIPPMESFFGLSGRLAEIFPSFEYRKQQADLAEEARRTLLRGPGEILAAEARLRE